MPGYLLNRLQYALMREAWNLVESGVCDFADIDRALTHGLGLRWAAIGPFEVQDVAGLDVHLAVASSLMPELGGPREPPERLREMVARGERGLATGSGLLGPWDAARSRGGAGPARAGDAGRAGGARAGRVTFRAGFRSGV